jgi:hypothetical protein
MAIAYGFSSVSAVLPRPRSIWSSRRGPDHHPRSAAS